MPFLPRIVSAFLIATVFAAAAPVRAAAPEVATGTVTGLPIPRFVSLKSDRVNLREGPSKDQRTRWVFQRAGLPVEVMAEFETWRRIRDSDGSEGWVLHSLLSGRRTVVVAPWAKNETHPIYENTDEKSPITARLQSGVIGNVKSCTGRWCRIFGDGFNGYIQQAKLWGVYPDEKLD